MAALVTFVVRNGSVLRAMDTCLFLFLETSHVFAVGVWAMFRTSILPAAPRQPAILAAVLPNCA